MSADQLYADYAANEVNADNLYRGKALRVSGTVEAIKKDIADNPYVVLATKNKFTGVHAKFDSARSLDRLSVGDGITVRCYGNNVIMGSPMLTGCVFN